ncbi:hypothetical protein ABIB90_003663 [Bradyrhizobium sp. JR4.1]|uniref:hypothetical protein n=1 Tax=unclassified Bradyrhizobium TaxID=2631580 RepID=UPI0033926BF9
MTAGQQVIADYYRMFPPREREPDRVVVREEYAFYAVDGERVICGRAHRYTEERYI